MTLTRDDALELDKKDQLAKYRERFYFPDKEISYLDGNSLGRLPLKTVEVVNTYLKNEWGLGYNNPHRGVFGEFFPPVPQIPGGVYTGITEHAFLEEAFGLECEYDLPETTWFMHLLAL